jgi:hypothetical protein
MIGSKPRHLPSHLGKFPFTLMMLHHMRPITEQARRFLYYASNSCRHLIPGWWFRGQLESLLQSTPPEEIRELQDRVDYYLRDQPSFILPSESVAIRDLKMGGRTTYYFDLCNVLRYFPAHLRLCYLFGDIREIPAMPAVVKSRPISSDNHHSVLMKLDQVRHFVFRKDTLPFRAKKDLIVWRGKCYGRPNRKDCIEKFHATPGCDIGDVNPKIRGQPGWKPFMTIADQMGFKFILSLEGNDVATNLKWIFASNSLCFTPRLRFETWFMEGRLEGGKHYVELRDDLSDMLEKRDYYARHPEEAEAIIANANRYVAQFLDPRRELLLQLLVMQKYFRLSGQLPAP